MKNLLAVERLIELGKKALEWVEENMPPDIFGTTEQAQLRLLRQVVEEAAAAGPGSGGSGGQNVFF